MGVTGLWKLIETCGQPVPVEMLENKVLAIDISIWLHQVVKGFQDNKGSALTNSHLLGLFHRLCKLMYYRIKPVFVFDGKVPYLKRETIAKRNLKRNKLINEAERIQNLLLQSLAKEKVVQQALGTKATAELLRGSPSKCKTFPKRPDIDDMYKLPDLPTINESNKESDLNSESNRSYSDINSSFEESKPRMYNDQNLQAIDVKSKHFRNLPADIRHEILIDIKDTRKQSSWGKLHELPSKSTDFSSFQMKRLLKRRQVQECLEQTEKELDGVRTFTMSELENIFSEEGIIEASNLPNTKHITSDSNTRFLLVRDLKRTLAASAVESKKVDEKSKIQATEITNNETLMKNCKLNVSDEWDDDLQKAIRMSLHECPLYNKSDYEYNGRLKLNKEQCKQLKNTAVGLARSYMIEHGGMNDEALQQLLNYTQSLSDDEEINLASLLSNDNKTPIESYVPENKPEPKMPFPSTILPKTQLQVIPALNSESKIIQEEKSHEQSLTMQIVREQEPEIGIISDSNSDSELEYACNNGNASQNKINDKLNVQANPNIEIFVDASKTISQDEDMFSDVFITRESKIAKSSSPNFTDILQDLKKQVEEVNNISLSDIKLDSSINETPDHERFLLSQRIICGADCEALNHCEGMTQVPLKITAAKVKNINESVIFINNDTIKYSKTELDKLSQNNEIIEIMDDAESTNIVPNFQSPSKTKTISEFFETKYVIKRTPDKLSDTIKEIPHIKSPFFVKKSPKSSSEINRRKVKTTLKKSSTVTKMLFESSNDADIGVKLIPDVELNGVEIAANALKANKTREELQDLACSLAKENTELEKEKNRQDRMGMSITERMNSECMQLLRLFGVPFIVAPMEAEAQCAFLDAMQLTNGTITDDSDIWLFGGRTVYKNFFAQNKHVIEFKSDKIESSFNVDRNKLIQLALLVGSDYTTGVHGIGTVTALEILATFSVKETTDTIGNAQTEAVLSTLQKFRDWWATCKSSIGNSKRLRLRNKLKNIELYDGFPSPTVVEAYLTPKIDDSQEAFSWGSPNVEAIREFTREKFGWTTLKTDEILGPVLKKINEKKSQATIKNYFAVKSTYSKKQLAVSKRVQTAINKMSEDYTSDENSDNIKAETKAKLGRRKKSSASTSTEKALKANKIARASNHSDIPMTSLEIIPQKLRNIKEMEERKELAAAVIRKSKQSRAKK